VRPALAEVERGTARTFQGTGAPPAIAFGEGGEYSVAISEVLDE
jgi:hypothetical protein